MPTNKITPLLCILDRHLPDASGVGGGTKLLRELAENPEKEVVADGPGALQFTLQLIDLLVSSAGRIIVCGQFPELASYRQILLRKDAGYSAGLEQKISYYQRYLDVVKESPLERHSLADLAGLVLAYRNYSGKDLLSKQISFADFEFTTSEYLELKNQVVITQRLYQKIERITPAFQSLNAGIFRHQTLEDSHEFLDRLLRTFSERSVVLHRLYLEATNRFYQQRRAEYQFIFRDLCTALQRVEKAVDLVVAEIGSAALESVPTRLAAGVSKRQRQQRTLVLHINDLLEELKKVHLTNEPFAFDWPQKMSDLTYSRRAELLTNYQQTLNEWFEEHRKLIREECLGLSSRTHEVHPEVNEQLIGLEKQLNELVEEINDSGIFQRPFTVQANTTARQQKLVEQLLEQLAELRQLMPAYPAFYRWQHNWFSLPARLRRTISPMLLLPLEEWSTLFSSWYFDQGLHLQPKAIVEAMTPQQVVDLAGEVIGANASYERRKGKAPKPDQLTLMTSTGETRAGKYDLVITVDDTTCPTTVVGPRLRLAPFSITAKPSHYLGIYNRMSPSLAFFQDWFGRSLPEWKADRHTGSWLDVKARLEKLAQENNILLEGEWSILENAYRERGREGLLIGLNQGKPVRVVALDKLTETSFIAVFIVYTPDRLHIDHLPSATYWWSLFLNTPTIQLLHRLPPDEITQSLLTDGANSAYGLAAFLRAVEAIEDRDISSFRAIANESRKRLGWRSPTAGPLLKELEPELLRHFPEHKVTLFHPWRTVYLPILLTSPSGKRQLILPDGVLPGSREALIELQLQRELAAAGFEIHYLNSLELVENLEVTLERLVKEIAAETTPTISA